jgi:hypothetical protein
LAASDGRRSQRSAQAGSDVPEAIGQQDGRIMNEAEPVVYSRVEDAGADDGRGGRAMGDRGADAGDNKTSNQSSPDESPPRHTSVVDLSVG